MVCSQFCLKLRDAISNSIKSRGAERKLEKCSSNRDSASYDTLFLVTSKRTILKESMQKKLPVFNNSETNNVFASSRD